MAGACKESIAQCRQIDKGAEFDLIELKHVKKQVVHAITHKIDRR